MVLSGSKTEAPTSLPPSAFDLKSKPVLAALAEHITAMRSEKQRLGDFRNQVFHSFIFDAGRRPARTIVDQLRTLHLIFQTAGRKGGAQPEHGPRSQAT